MNVYRRDDFVGMDIDFPAVPPAWWDPKRPVPYRNAPLARAAIEGEPP